MAAFVHTAALIALVVLLAVAAVGDVRRFTIPNGLCLAIAGLSVPWWLSGPDPLWPAVGWQLLFALAVFMIFAWIFAQGWMGGGDVKLFAALALWFPWKPFLQMMIWTTILGGVLTLAIVIAHRLRKRLGQPEIPYGVAIAIGAIVTVAKAQGLA